MVLHSSQISPQQAPPQTSSSPQLVVEAPPQASQIVFHASQAMASVIEAASPPQASQVIPPTNLLPSIVNQIEIPHLDLIQLAQPSFSQLTSPPVIQPQVS